MSRKKLINSPDRCVDEGLYGVWRSYPSLALHSAERCLFRTVTNEKRRCAAVLSGGGSGHEPFPFGYVGKGMLTASVSGSIFSSPPKRHILHAIRKLSETHDGIFLIVPNYTGDRLNFGLALETADREGIKIESVVVGDDVAQVAYGKEGKSGRRGTCGLILVLKIAGYLSNEEKSLHQLKNATEKVTEQMASIGVSLEACTIPGSGPLYNLSRDEVELGVGVHGEAGVGKMKLKSASETVKILLEPLMRHLKLGQSADDEVVALVNNLGCLSQIEQWIVAGEVDKQISKKGIKLSRMYVGSLFTSLDTTGVQICLLKLNPEIKELVLRALDEPTNAPAWPSPFSLNATVVASPPFAKLTNRSQEKTSSGGELTDVQSKLVENCLIEASKLIMENEEKVNLLDSGCGDGDCGTTVARLARQILNGIHEKRFDLRHPARLFSQLGEIADGSMGGTTGAVYGLFLAGASARFSINPPSSVGSAVAWATAWAAGVQLIKKYSVARIGDRTLMDALEPSCDAFRLHLEKHGIGSGKMALAAAVESAREGCDATRHMKAAVGRASYVDTSQLKDVDAGAFAITLWLTAFQRIVCNSP